MHKLMTLARYSLREIVAMPAYRIMLLSTFVLAIFAMVISQLFLLETIKVQLDFLWLGTSLLGITYILMIAASMLGQDISGHIAYLFLPHMPRTTYLLGRTLGILAGLLLLLGLMALISTLSLAFSLEQLPTSQPHDPAWWSPLLLSGIALLQSTTVLAIVVFTAAWASGFIEMLLFSTAFTGLAYLLPSVLAAMTTSEVLAQTPAWVASLIHGVDYLFPDMNGGEVALSLAHGLSLNPGDIGWLCTAQIGYTMMIFATGILLFARRDL
ncbi:MAG: hypothetical protein R8K50_07860 [Mariprofundus sp.]